MFEDVTMGKVKEVIDFAGKKFKESDIPELQEKGATALCKILQGRQYAYLADEVGMGKTYQAIGVISMLLKEKSDARILIIAPSERVQRNWEYEINNFRKENLKDKNLDKSIKLKKIKNKGDFIASFKKDSQNKDSENIFIIRLTIFSTIADFIVKKGSPEYSYSGEISVKKLFKGLTCVTGSSEKYKFNSQDSEKICGKFNSQDSGKICGKFLRNYTPYFDLVVIDEAQNIRNENNATVFLNYWLGLKRWSAPEGKLGEVFDHITQKNDEDFEHITQKNGEVFECIPQKNKESKFLLLSATPTHRGIESLKNQISYFEDQKTDKFTQDYLSDFLIRRLRTYDGKKKYNKYNIREITTNDISKDLNEDNKDGLMQRLFLALVQSKLAINEVKNNARYKIGFLETFESYSPTDSSQKDAETGEYKEFENGASQKDGEKGFAPDKKILKSIKKSFDDSFNKKCKREYPPHPKLGFMENEVKELLNKTQSCLTNAPEKALVFVRRLASANELEKRLNKVYEDKIISYWAHELGIGESFKEIQKEFEDRYKKKVEKEIDNATETKEAVEEREESELRKWLAIKKDHRGRGYYAVSKFKKSLNNKTLFSENYYSAYLKKDVNEIVDDDFVNEVNAYIAGNGRYVSEHNGEKRYNSPEILPVCCYVALKRKKETEKAEFIKKFYDIKRGGNENCGYSKSSIKKILKQDSVWNQMIAKGVNIDNQDPYKREVLKAVAEKYIKSSEAVLELLYAYIKAKENELCKLVVERLFSEKCTHGVRIKELFENGELVCKELHILDSEEKEDGKSKDGMTVTELRKNLSFLNWQQWVMSATGGNDNERARKRFNTPFYPDIIVCTDVFKEGINLHLFCNHVYHYGLAWTPGDLEQRVGRVDRVFSKTYRERIEQGKETKVKINYPYLGKSIDELQLKQVLKFKVSADLLLDSKHEVQKDIQVDDLEEKTVKELADYIPENVDNEPYSGEKFWKGG